MELSIWGHFRLRVWNPDGSLADEGEGRNLMTTAGLYALAQAINYAGVQDVNANWGSPFVAYNLTPVYLAVGTSSTTPAITDTILGTEVARATIAAAGVSSGPALVVWDAIFGTGIGPQTIAEVGVFAQASATANSGTLIDHALVSPTVNWAANQTLTCEVTFTVEQGT